jgi:hypothetical protein
MHADAAVARGPADPAPPGAAHAVTTWAAAGLHLSLGARGVETRTPGRGTDSSAGSTAVSEAFAAVAADHADPAQLNDLRYAWNEAGQALTDRLRPESSLAREGACSCGDSALPWRHDLPKHGRYPTRGGSSPRTQYYPTDRETRS